MHRIWKFHTRTNEPKKPENQWTVRRKQLWHFHGIHFEQLSLRPITLWWIRFPKYFLVFSTNSTNCCCRTEWMREIPRVRMAKKRKMYPCVWVRSWGVKRHRFDCENRINQLLSTYGWLWIAINLAFFPSHCVFLSFPLSVLRVPVNWKMERKYVEIDRSENRNKYKERLLGVNRWRCAS